MWSKYSIFTTFDRVEKDVKVADKQDLLHILKCFFNIQVTLVAQLGVIGGTMGLFTGFSILSGIEIFYFAGKFFLGRIRSKVSSVGGETP